MCAPYFVNLNNNTFQLKRYYSLFIYVRGKRERKKSSPIISLRYSELSWDLSSGAVCLGVDSPGSVPGPPQRQRSWQCASCAEVHCVVAVKMSVVKCKLPMLLWLPRYLFTSTTFEYIWSVDLNLLYYDVTTELILVYIAPHYVIFKDPFWLKFAVCFIEPDCHFISQKTFVMGKSVQAYFCCFLERAAMLVLQVLY